MKSQADKFGSMKGYVDENSAILKGVRTGIKGLVNEDDSIKF